MFHESISAYLILKNLTNTEPVNRFLLNTRKVKFVLNIKEQQLLAKLDLRKYSFDKDGSQRLTYRFLSQLNCYYQ